MKPLTQARLHRLLDLLCAHRAVDVARDLWPQSQGG
jgi:hypothetical protein